MRPSGRERGPARSGTSSARTTETSRGASMPSRTWPPSSRTTVTQMSSPIKSFSISFRVNTSMARFLGGRLARSPASPRQHVWNSGVGTRGLLGESRSCPRAPELIAIFRVATWSPVPTEPLSRQGLPAFTGGPGRPGRGRLSPVRGESSLGRWAIFWQHMGRPHDQVIPGSGDRVPRTSPALPEAACVRAYHSSSGSRLRARWRSVDRGRGGGGRSGLFACARMRTR
jgi:hypothetical protein